MDLDDSAERRLRRHLDAAYRPLIKFQALTIVGDV